MESIHLHNSLNFELSSHKITPELTRATHIILNLLYKNLNFRQVHTKFDLD
jgi:hypothetical protein